MVAVQTMVFVRGRRGLVSRTHVVDRRSCEPAPQGQGVVRERELWQDCAGRRQEGSPAAKTRCRGGKMRVRWGESNRHEGGWDSI